jgi:hypothetical protein
MIAEKMIAEYAQPIRPASPEKETPLNLPAWQAV